jgi:dolichyl-diphosphooligosaccharide--protein glycosyltransferase
MAVAVLATMVALSVAEREKPGIRHVVERKYGRLRRPIGYSVLAGVAIALYIWVWPPGVVLVGILGCFFAIELSAGFVRGENPEHVAFVGVVALAVTGFLTLWTMEVTAIHPTAAGPLQPALAFAVAGGCVFMTWLARTWENRGVDERYYPVAIAGVAVVSAAAIALFFPRIWETILRAVYGRLLPVGYTSTALTVPEAAPPEDVHQYFYQQYGPAFYAAMVGLVALVVRTFFGNDHRAEHALIAVWAPVLTSMAFTQIRFHYYYVLPVAVLNAYLVGQIVGGIDRSRFPRIRPTDAGRVLLCLAVISVLVVPLTPLVASATVVDAGQDESPSRDAMRWKSTNEWFAQHSPEPGAWGGAEKQDQIEYYGTYQMPADGDFEYPDAAYGVMSWWDYGHLITVQAERIPHANPFQENARSAAAFLTAGSEEQGELVLEALLAAGDDDNLNRLDDDELAALADERTAQQEGEGIRYVMIDDEMAGQKFDAIATYAGADPGVYWDDQEVEVNEDRSTVNGTITAPVRNDAYDDTVLSRLYYDDADGMEHYRLVHDDNQATRFVSVAVSRDGGESWQPLFVNRPLTQGVEDSLSGLREDPDVEVAVYDERVQPAVKVYERVEGAELTGSVDAPAGATVTAELQLTAEQFDRTFVDTQTATVGEDGEFSMTVPYATEEDASVEDGYTDSDVVADSTYRISVDGEIVGSAEVAESTIYEGGTGELTLNSARSTSSWNSSSSSPFVRP